MSAEIKRIVLKIGDKEINLTPDEAKELRDVLGEIFGRSETLIIPSPYPVPYNPYPNWWVYTGANKVYCTDTVGTITISNTSN